MNEGQLPQVVIKIGKPVSARINRTLGKTARVSMAPALTGKASIIRSGRDHTFSGLFLCKPHRPSRHPFGYVPASR